MAAREKVANAERKCRPVFHGREGVGDGAAFIQDASAMTGQSPYSASNLLGSNGARRLGQSSRGQSIQLAKCFSVGNRMPEPDLTGTMR